MTQFCCPRIRPYKRQNWYSLTTGSFPVSRISPATRPRKRPFPRRVTPYCRWLRYFRIACLPPEAVRLGQERRQEYATFWHYTISHFLFNKVRRLLIMWVSSLRVFSSLLLTDKIWPVHRQASCQ